METKDKKIALRKNFEKQTGISSLSRDYMMWLEDEVLKSKTSEANEPTVRDEKLTDEMIESYAYALAEPLNNPDDCSNPYDLIKKGIEFARDFYENENKE